METLCLKNYEICSKLTVKTPEQSYRLCSVVFIIRFDHIYVFFTEEILNGKLYCLKQNRIAGTFNNF